MCKERRCRLQWWKIKPIDRFFAPKRQREAAIQNPVLIQSPRRHHTMINLNNAQTDQRRADIAYCLNNKLMCVCIANNWRAEVLAYREERAKTFEQFLAGHAVQLRGVCYLQVAATGDLQTCEGWKGRRAVV